MKGTSKILDELKSIIWHTFNLTTLFAYSHHKDDDFGWDNLKKAHINNSKDVIITAMKNRRHFMESALAYRELVGKRCERIKSYYYQENFDALLEETMWCDVSLNNQLKILDEYYMWNNDGYDGFLKKELDREIKPVYTKDHESFLI